MRNTFNVFSFLLLTSSFWACKPNAKIKVDMLFFNGVVYTANQSFEVAEAFAVKEGKIVAIGTNDEIGDAYASENEQDLQKAVV